MFVEEEELTAAHRQRPRLVADTSLYPFLSKYLEREFDRDIRQPAADTPFPADYELAPLMLSSVNAANDGSAEAAAEKAFINICNQNQANPVSRHLSSGQVCRDFPGLSRVALPAEPC